MHTASINLTEKTVTAPAVVTSCTVTTFDHGQLPHQSQLEDKRPAASWRSVLRVLAVSAAAALGSLTVGFFNGYSSPAIPNLNRNPNPFHVGPEDQSWFGSLLFLGAVPSALFSGWLMDLAGRRGALVVAPLPAVAGWVIITAAGSVPVLMAGRLLSGVALGILLSTVGVYISEVAPANLRGLLMSLHEVLLNAGLLAIYLLGGWVLPWNWLAVVGAAVACGLACCMAVSPETPRWLVMRGRREEALEVLEWLRDDEQEAAQQLSDIERSVRETAEDAPWSDFLRPPLRRNLLVSQALFVLQELSGINVIRFYAVSMFEAAGSELDADSCAATVAALLLLGSALFSSVVERRERRTFLLLSSVMMAASMWAMGAFHLVTRDGAVPRPELWWLPLTAMAVATVGYVLGVGPMPYIVTSELFGTRTRGRASCLGVTTLSISGFLITKLFHNMMVGFGAFGAYWFCASVCSAGAVLAFFFLPETRGKSLETLQKTLGT